MREADPGLPIIVMSGADDGAVKGHSVATGAQDFFVKGGTDGALLSRAIEHAVERQRLLNELENARKEALRQKDLFLSQVAHELRTPLTALSYFVTLVADVLDRLRHLRHRYLLCGRANQGPLPRHRHGQRQGTAQSL